MVTLWSRNRDEDRFVSRREYVRWLRRDLAPETPTTVYGVAIDDLVITNPEFTTCSALK